MMEVMVTTGVIRCAKLQSNRQHQQTNTQLFAVWMPFLSPNQQFQAHLQVTSLSLPLVARGYLDCQSSRQPVKKGKGKGSGFI